MGFLEEIISPPTAHQLLVLKVLLVVSLLVHLPFMGMLIGGTALSIAFKFLHRETKNPLHLRFSRDLVDTFATNKGVGVLLGLLPLLTIGVIYLQVLAGSTTAPAYYWVASVLLAGIGLAHVYWYQDRFPQGKQGFFIHLGAGAAGVGALLGAYFVFFAGMTLVIDPEKWISALNPYWASLSWNHVARFVHFLALAFAMTGVGIVFFFFHWPGRRKEEMDARYEALVKRVGIGLALPFISLQPLAWFWDLYTLPPGATTPALWDGSIPGIVLAAFTCHLLYRTLRKPGSRHGVSAFLLFFVVFGLAVVNEQRAAAHATQEYVRLATFRAEEKWKEMELEAAETWRKIDPALLGKRIFENNCTACHSLQAGQTKIGPSLHGLFGTKVTLTDGRTITRDDAYVREAITDPDAKIVKGFSKGTMTANIKAGMFKGKQLEALVEFLQKQK